MVLPLEELLKMGLDVKGLVSEEVELQVVCHDEGVESWWFGKEWLKDWIVGCLVSDSDSSLKKPLFMNDQYSAVSPSVHILQPSKCPRLLNNPGRYLAADTIAVSNASLGSRSLAPSSIIFTVIIKLSPVPDKAGISPASASHCRCM